MATTMQSKDERTLHKTSPIFILLDNIKKILFPVLIALIGPGGSYWEYIALAVALIVSLGAIVQYRFYRYWLEPNQIRVKKGLSFAMSDRCLITAFKISTFHKTRYTEF